MVPSPDAKERDVQHLKDPRQHSLFDVFEDVLSPVAYRKLKRV
jgi:hypothetical protein